MKNFLYIDLNKSATATKPHKWYDHALERGGRWITIHPHGKGAINEDGEDVKGQRILIDGSGHVLAGGPKAWEGRPISDVAGDHEVKPEARPNAVEQTHQELGKGEFEDRKGKWSLNYVSRERRDNDGKSHYYSYLNFEPNAAAGIKGNSIRNSGHIHFTSNSDKDYIKNAIKNTTGYTPDKATVDKIFEHISKLRDAHDEQDRHYAEKSDADREKARQTLDELHKKAVDQYKADPTALPGLDDYQRKHPHRHLETYRVHLSKADQEKAREAQRVLNGHSYEAPDKGYGSVGHMADLNKKIWTDVANHDKNLENAAKDKRKAELDDRFEKEPALRKLVAQYLAAQKAQPHGPGDAERELAYRLFGYAKNEDQAQKAGGKLSELKKKLGLDYGELSSLAYRHKDETLPPVTPEHTREDGAIYVGDKAYDKAGNVHEIKKVGRDYLHTRYRDQIKHGELSLHEYAPTNKEAKTDDEHMDNALRYLHNFGKYGGAHNKNFEHVAKHIADRGANNRSTIDFIRKASMDTKNEGTRKAFKKLSDEIRRHELDRMINSPGWSFMKDKLQAEADQLGPSNIGNVPEFKPSNEPAPAPEPPKAAPKPAEEPKPQAGGKGKGEKPAKTGYGEGATMHVPGGPNTFKHLKQLKHNHGGKWNAEQQRWEFNHAHGSEGHKNLEDYAKANGLDLNLHGEGAPAAGGSAAPAEPPKAEEAPQGPSNEGGKKGKVVIGGGNTFPHKGAIKYDHGGVWNKDAKQWEVHDVAHGSEKHKALQQFAKERGLTAEHEHDEKKRDLSKESPEQILANVPSKEEIKEHLAKKDPAYYGHDDENVTEKVNEVHKELTEMAKNKELHPHIATAIKHRKDSGLDPDMIEYAHRIHRKAKKEQEYAAEEAEREKARKTAEEENERLKGIKAEAKPMAGGIADWAKADHDADTIKKHVVHELNQMRAQQGHEPMTAYNLKTQDSYIKDHAANISAAMDEVKKNPALAPFIQEYLDKQKDSALYKRRFMTGDHIGAALGVAKQRASRIVHTTGDGRKIEFDPKDIKRGHVKGSRNSSNYHTVYVNGGRRYIPIPDNGKAITKDQIAKWVEGAGDEAHSFVHHVLSGNKEPFVHQGATAAKATKEYKPFEAPPEGSRGTKAYMDKAKEDMLAHGAHAVVFNGTGTAEERAKAAHTIASAMRAMTHIIGENMPSVELVIGGTSGNTLAHYRAGYRSITINPKVGRASFVHEFGHFIDDAINGFKGLRGGVVNGDGKYHESAAFHTLAREMEKTDAAQKKLAQYNTSYNRKFYNYYKTDHERFARFFAQWLPHEAKKRGFELPKDMLDEAADHENYNEHYTPAELDRFGDLVKEAMKSKGLWKGLLEFIRILGTPIQREHKLYIKL